MDINLKTEQLYLGRDLEDIEILQIASGIACAYTHQSPGKATGNEDSIGLIPCDDHSAVLVVADGLGGLPAGKQASALAIGQLNESVQRACRDDSPIREAVLDGIEQGNATILGLGIGAATTIAVVEIEDREIRSFHAGDSMILVCGQRGKIKYQTISHSPTGYAVEAGLVHQDDAIYHEDRHLVSNMVGMSDMRVEIGAKLTLAVRDTLLVASDGLFDNLVVTEIVDIIRAGPLPAAAERLRELCLERMNQASGIQPNKPDDLSFILFRLR